MKNRYRRPGLVLWLLCSAGAQGATLELIPSATNLLPGDTLTVDVVISGLGNAAPASLGAYDLELLFDEPTLQFTGHVLGLELGDVGLGEAVTGSAATPGAVNVFDVSLLTPAQLIAGQGATFTLLTVSFAVSSGVSTLELSLLSALADENGAPIPLEPLAPIAVSVGATPGIPTLSPWLLLLLALLLMTVGVFSMRGTVR